MFYAGVAKVDITPPVGVDLQGYAGRYKGSEGILDPLYARCLVVECQGRRWALISADLISLETADAQQVRDLAQEALVTPQASVSLACTHTHSGPALLRLRRFGAIDEAYRQHLIRVLGQMVREAVRQLRPVTIHSVRGQASFAVNRRRPEPDGRIALAPYPDGPVDHEVVATVLFPGETGGAAATGESPVAILTSYGCHPVTLGANYLISADFPGVFTRTVEQVFPNTLALYLNGASGDVNPPAMGDPKVAYRCGLELAGEVIKLVATAGTVPAEPEVLLWTEETLQLPLGDLPSREALYQQLEQCDERLAALQGRSDGSSHAWQALKDWAATCLAELEGAAAAPHRTEAPIQVVRLGQTGFAFVPGELFTELGMEIKQHSLLQPVHVVGYANGWVGYLPTEDAVAKGGYEPTAYRYWQSRPLAPEAGRLVTQAALRGLAAVGGP